MMLSMKSTSISQKLANYATKTFSWVTCNGAAVLTPIVAGVALRTLLPFATIPLVAKGVGTWVGKELYRKVSLKNVEKTYEWEKTTVDFIQKYLYIIYIASLISEIAIAYLCPPLAIALAFTSGIIIGCAIEGTLVKEQDEKPDPSNDEVVY